MELRERVLFWLVPSEQIKMQEIMIDNAATEYDDFHPKSYRKCTGANRVKKHV